MKSKNCDSTSSIENVSLILIFFLSLLFNIWALTMGWNLPLQDLHGFRQTQTAISAYYLLNGSSWIDYQTPILGSPWSIPFEFPLYQWIVAIWHLVSGTRLDQSGRFVSVCFFYAFIACFYKVLNIYSIKKCHRLVFLSLVLCSPLYVFWSRAFLIESTALFFGMLSLLFLGNYLKNKKSAAWIGASIAAIIGALVKITTMYGFILCGLFIWGEKHFKSQVKKVEAKRSVKFQPQLESLKCLIFDKSLRKNEDIIAAVKIFVGFIVAPLLLTLMWTGHSDYLKKLNPMATDFITSESLKTWNFGTLKLRLSLEFWDVIFNRFLNDLNGSAWVLPICLGSSVLAGANFIRIWMFAIVTLLVLLTFSNLHYVHNYYQYALGVFPLMSIGFVLISWLDASKVKKIVAVGSLAVLLMISSNYYLNSFYIVQTHPTLEIFEIADFIKANTKSGEVLLINGLDWDSSLPYYSERRALMDRWNLSVNHPKLHSALSLLSQFRMGAHVFCGSVKDSQALLIDRRSVFQFESVPSFSNRLCDVYISRM